VLLPANWHMHSPFPGPRQPAEAGPRSALHSVAFSSDQPFQTRTAHKVSPKRPGSGIGAGALHEPDDPTALPRAMATRVRTAACSRRGHPLARDRHSAVAMAAGHEAIYEAIVA